MTHPDTLACAHDDDLIERAALGLLAPVEEPKLARRLAECPACRTRLAECRMLAAAVAALDPHPAPIVPDATALPTHARGPNRMLPDIAGERIAPIVPNRAAHNHARRRYEGWYVAAAVLLLAGMAAFTFNAFAGAHPTRGPHPTVTATHTPVSPTPTITVTPRPLTLPTGTMLDGLSMDSPDDGWAIGRVMPGLSGPGADQGSLILHYTAGQWAIAGRYRSLALVSIAMLSATEGWISGSMLVASATSATVAVLLHYHNGIWTQQSLPGLGAPIKMQMVSASEGWALGGPTSATTGCPNGAPTCSGGGVGGSPPPHYSGLLHDTDGTWSVVTFPAGLTDTFWWRWHTGAEDLSMDSADDGWAICQGELMHYHGGQWTYGGSLPGMGGNSRIAMLSATDGWATGPGLNGTSPTPEVAYHYNGHSWSPVPLPASLTAQGSDLLLSVYPESDGSVYFVNGVYRAKDVIAAVVVRYATGQWQPAGFPANIFASTIQGSWALGWIQGETPWHSVILHQQDSDWVAWPGTA